MTLLTLFYLIIGAVVCGANYFVMQDGICRPVFDDLDCAFGSIGVGFFWPLCIGIVAVRMYRYIQKHK